MALAPEKIRAIRKAARFFSAVPFVGFVVLSGSCARGTAGEGSDIDVIIGCSSGRVWAARFFSLLFSDLCGIRNKIGRDPRDKLCMSVFISPEDCLIDDKEVLETGLKPLFGCEGALRDFYDKNRIGVVGALPSEYLVGGEKKPLSRLMEALLSRKLGDWFEKAARVLQKKKISRYAGLVGPYGIECRLAISDDRVETSFREA